MILEEVYYGGSIMKSEKITSNGCKWYQEHNGVLGCFLHPLSDNTPSHCTNSEKHPCKRLKNKKDGEK